MSHRDESNTTTEIAEKTYWVGNRPEGETLYSNSFLRRFGGDGEQRHFNLLVDPASSGDFQVVLSKIADVLGEVSEVSAMVLNHQDPDLSSSVGVLLEEYVPDAPVLCTDDTGELIHNYHDVSPGQLVELEDYPKGLELPTGDVVIPVAVPFCHFRGATMLYDPETRVLFSGDLFSSVTAPGADGLMADESDWAGMRAFHQLYMPTRSAVVSAIERIEEFEPAVELIAPQHGRLIAGDNISKFAERLASLPMGVDVADGDGPEEGAGSVLLRVVDTAMETVGKGATQEVLDDDSQRSITTATVERIVRRLCENANHRAANVIRYTAIEAAANFDAPTPAVLPDETFVTATDDDAANTANAGFSAVK